MARIHGAQIGCAAVTVSSPVSHPTNGAGGGVFERGLFSRVNTPRQHWLASGLLPNCYIVL